MFPVRFGREVSKTCVSRSTEWGINEVGRRTAALLSGSGFADGAATTRLVKRRVMMAIFILSFGVSKGWILGR
jgi:hypothetical protein